MSPAPAFWVDRGYDREYASDGISRYGAYLRDAAFEPWTDHDQAVEWAVFAWRRATSPVMSPGYVRCHPAVLAARLERSGWDGGLSRWRGSRVGLAGAAQNGAGHRAGARRPRHVLAGLAYRIPQRRDPQLLPAQRGGCCGPAVSAGHGQLAVHHALGRAPGAPCHPGRRAGRWQQAVAVVVARLNQIVGPVLAASLGGTSSATGMTW